MGTIVETSSKNVIPDFSDLSICDLIPHESGGRNDMNDKENIPPSQSTWYEGVIIRPVAFKATARRLSHK